MSQITEWGELGRGGSSWRSAVRWQTPNHAVPLKQNVHFYAFIWVYKGIRLSLQVLWTFWYLSILAEGEHPWVNYQWVFFLVFGTVAGNSTVTPGRCHEPTALLSVPDLTCKAKKRNFPCCQSLNMSTNTLHNTGSQEALQTQTNYIKLLHAKMELHFVWDAEERKGEVKIEYSSEPIFASSLDMFKHIYSINTPIIYNINAPTFLLSKHWKQPLHSSSLHYISVEQRILNKSNEIQTEALLLPRLTHKG